jgi:hypothetical protein
MDRCRRFEGVNSAALAPPTSDVDADVDIDPARVNFCGDEKDEAEDEEESGIGVITWAGGAAAVAVVARSRRAKPKSRLRGLPLLLLVMPASPAAGTDDGDGDDDVVVDNNKDSSTPVFVLSWLGLVGVENTSISFALSGIDGVGVVSLCPVVAFVGDSGSPSGSKAGATGLGGDGAARGL